MQIYGTVLLDPPEAPVTQLTLGGTELDISLDNGASSFVESVEDDVLVLVPDSGGTTWKINMRALSILNSSGVSELELKLEEESIRISASMELTGTIYAALRAKGFVSGDFILYIDQNATVVAVDGQSWILNADGELIAP